MRPDIEQWLDRAYSDAIFHDEGGQRLVYRIGSMNAALKIWRLEDADQRERHVREVSALDRIDHPRLPNVVAPLAQVEIAGVVLVFYLEQWFDAPSVKASFGRLPLSRDESTDLATTTLSALSALHAGQIVHRDVSLGNVLIGADGGFVIDLGLAKHLDLDSLTGAGVRLPLTQATASPEQLQGASTDLRSSTDIFSLGVVLTYAATGQHPFVDQGESVQLNTLVHRELAGDVRNLPPDGLGEVVSQMLNPVTFMRPSAGAVLEMLS